MHLGPKLSGKGLLGSSPENSSLRVGPLFFCCSFVMDHTQGSKLQVGTHPCQAQDDLCPLVLLSSQGTYLGTTLAIPGS